MKSKKHRLPTELTHVAVPMDPGYAVVRPGFEGWNPLPPGIRDEEAADATVSTLHSVRRPTPEEREAASFGAAWGWLHDGADPVTWTSNMRR